jgi:hypothetical protein
MGIAQRDLEERFGSVNQVKSNTWRRNQQTRGDGSYPLWTVVIKKGSLIVLCFAVNSGLG